MNTVKSIYRVRSLILSIVILIIFLPAAWSFSPGMRRGMIGGPWELVVQSDVQTDSTQIPVTVPDENKITELNKTFPVIGSTKKIQLKKYLPNLQWKVLSEKYDGFADTAQIRISGPNFEQVRWLSSEDRSRSGVSSRIGGIRIKSLSNSADIDSIVQQLIKPEVIGLVSVVLDEKSKPLQFAVKRGFKVELPNSEYTLKVLNYYPHFAINKETQKAQNQSDQPKNPAIEVQIEKGEKQYRQWIWSRLSSPHMKYNLPVKVQFHEFNHEMKKGYYSLLVASEDKFWLITNEGENKILEKAQINKTYPLADDKYGFVVTQVRENTILKDEWYNESQALISPGLVVNVQDGDQSDQYVLQLNKSQRTKDKVDGSILLFRKDMDMPDSGKK